MMGKGLLLFENRDEGSTILILDEKEYFSYIKNLDEGLKSNCKELIKQFKKINL